MTYTQYYGITSMFSFKTNEVKKYHFINEKVIVAFVCSIVSLVAFSSFLSNINVDNMNKLLSQAYGKIVICNVLK